LVAGTIFPGGILGFEMHADEIANGGYILLAGEPVV